jgi:hypothetical protein
MTVHECVADALQNGLGETLSALEQRRQQVLQGNKKIMLWLGGATIVVLAGMLIGGQHWGFALVAGFIVFVIVALIVSRRKAKLAHLFKQEAIPELLRTALPGFWYASSRYVSEFEFNSANLFIRPDRYSGKDYFEGTHGKTRLHFSLVHAEERYETTTTDTDSDGHTTTRTEEHWRDIFKGLFFAADFNKHFNGCTLVRAGKAGIFSGLFGNLVKLEDPRFNQQFKVYSSDQMEARYLLTPRMMERLLDLKDSLGSIELSFVGSWVNIAAGGFPYNAFEPDVKHPFTDPAQVERTLGWIFLVVGIVEELDLNTRIWSKQ